MESYIGRHCPPTQNFQEDANHAEPDGAGPHGMRRRGLSWFAAYIVGRLEERGRHIIARNIRVNSDPCRRERIWH